MYKTVSAPLPSALLVVAVGLLVLLPALGTLPLIDRDEPRFARATVEMQERNDWIIPTFNGAYRFDKPPLTYWLMRAGYAVCGVNEAGARLHSVAAAIGVALLILAMGREWWGPASGLLGALAWLTCFQVFVHGRLSLADMPMVFCVTLAHWAFYRLLTRPQPRFGRWFWTLYLALAFGFLAKGPVAWLIPALTLAGWRFVFRPQGTNLRWSQLQPVSGCLLMLAPVAAWGVPALLFTHGQFWDVGMGEHVVKRGTQAFNGRIPFVFFYLITAWVSLYPWSVLAPAVYYRVRREWQPLHGFLLSWFLGPVLLFSLYATQLPHYILPGFPAFFLLAAPLLAATDAEHRLPRGSCLALGIAGVIALALLLFACFGLPHRYPVERLGPLLAGVALWLLGMTLLPLSLERRRVAVALGLAGLALIAAAGFGIGRGARAISPMIKIADFVRRHPQVSQPIGVTFQEPGLVFYTGKPWTFLSPEEALRQLPEENGKLLVLSQQREYKIGDLIKGKTAPPGAAPDNAALTAAFAKRHPSAGIESMWISGINFARASWVELEVRADLDPDLLERRRAATPIATPTPVPNAAPARISVGK